MSHANQEMNFNASANITANRRRGRPRKYPRIIFEENTHPTQDQNLNHREYARVPLGFEGANGNQPRQVEPIDNPISAMVGQVVSGVIEAVFDAGYLLNVRVSESETNLRGVVFKPGRYIPVSAENDIAPGVQMIRRTEIPAPTENYSRVFGYNPQSRQKYEQLGPRTNGTAHPFNESPAANQVGVKYVPSAATHTTSSVISRGNPVPVMQKHVIISNGSLLPNQPSPVLALSSKGKQVPAFTRQALHLSNVSTPTEQMPTVGNKVLPSQSQSSHPVLPKGGESGLFNPTSDEAKSMILPSMPFEKLLTEVIKRIEGPSQPAESQVDNSKLAGTLPVKDSDHSLEDDVDDMNQPLEVEPLQSVQPDLHNHSASVPNPLANNRTGKMTELLQENMMNNQAPRAEEPAAGSGLN